MQKNKTYELIPILLQYLYIYFILAVKLLLHLCLLQVPFLYYLHYYAKIRWEKEKPLHSPNLLILALMMKPTTSVTSVINFSKKNLVLISFLPSHFYLFYNLHVTFMYVFFASFLYYISLFLFMTCIYAQITEVQISKESKVLMSMTIVATLLMLI